MSTSIFCIFQRREYAVWRDVPSEYEEDQDYYLFRWLSGIPTIVDFDPIAPPRGFPNDFDVIDGCRHPLESLDVFTRRGKIRWLESKDKVVIPYKFMGERGYSWLLGSEILTAHIPVRRFSFLVYIDDYLEWDRLSIPRDWLDRFRCDVVRPRDDSVSTPEAITTQTEYVLVDFECDFTDYFSYFLNEVRRVENLYGGVRLVFGFA